MKRKKIIGMAFAAMMAVVAIMPATTAKASAKYWSANIPILRGEVCNWDAWKHGKDSDYGYGGISAGTINCADCYTLVGWAVNSNDERRSNPVNIEQRDWSTIRVKENVDCGNMEQGKWYAPKLRNYDKVWHSPACSGGSNWDGGGGL